MSVRTLGLMLAATALLLPIGTAPAVATPDHYTPRSGPTFNSPLGDGAKQRAIFRKVMRSINSTPRGSNIKIFTWNFLTQEGKRALLRAQRRGVRVRLLMDDRNVTMVDNPPFRQLRRGLRAGNKEFPAKRRSWARLCQGSCRGGKGSAHSKFFMFSKVGKARRVYMHGSANFTIASTTNQWNDLYTHVGNRKVWEWASKRFKEAARDRRARDPYSTRSFGDFRLMMFPNTGKRSPDPIMQALRKVRCHGARNTASGTTRIRIAPDVIRNPRGMRLATKVRALWERGCNIRIGYTVVGVEVGRMLREDTGRGPVPMKHLVQDFDGDGEFDNYFHLKSMTIVGHYGKDTTGNVLINGSANWSGLANVSDENLGLYRSKNRVRRYEKHISYWYENFPGTAKAKQRGTARARVDGDQLVFGYGRDAVYEDGTSVSNGEFDPFANLELD